MRGTGTHSSEHQCNSGDASCFASQGEAFLTSQVFRFCGGFQALLLWRGLAKLHAVHLCCAALGSSHAPALDQAKGWVQKASLLSCNPLALGGCAFDLPWNKSLFTFSLCPQTVSASALPYTVPGCGHRSALLLCSHPQQAPVLCVLRKGLWEEGWSVRDHFHRPPWISIPYASHMGAIKVHAILG